MRSELKIGAVLGVVIIVGAVIWFANSRDEQGGSDIPPPPEPMEMAEPEEEPMVEPMADDPVVIVDPPVREDPCAGVEVEEEEAAVAEEPEVEPKPVVEEREARYYVVKAGDTLWGISEQWYGHGRFGKVIAEANKTVIKNPDSLQVGWKLRIPYPDEVKGN